MRNPNGPSIEEKEVMADRLLDMNEDWLKIQETLEFIRQVVSGRCDKLDLLEIKRAVDECLENLNDSLTNGVPNRLSRRTHAKSEGVHNSAAR